MNKVTMFNNDDAHAYWQLMLQDYPDMTYEEAFHKFHLERAKCPGAHVDLRLYSRDLLVEKQIIKWPMAIPITPTEVCTKRNYRQIAAGENDKVDMDVFVLIFVSPTQMYRELQRLIKATKAAPPSLGKPDPYLLHTTHGIYCLMRSTTAGDGIPEGKRGCYRIYG